MWTQPTSEFHPCHHHQHPCTQAQWCWSHPRLNQKTPTCVLPFLYWQMWHPLKHVLLKQSAKYMAKGRGERERRVTAEICKYSILYQRVLQFSDTYPRLTGIRMPKTQTLRHSLMDAWPSLPLFWFGNMIQQFSQDKCPRSNFHISAWMSLSVFYHWMEYEHLSLDHCREFERICLINVAMKDRNFWT